MPANRSSNCGIYHGNYNRIRSFQSCGLRNCRYFIVSIFYAVNVRLFQKRKSPAAAELHQPGRTFLLCDHVASVILSLGDSTYWTGSLTCSTIDAGISINNICIFAFRNCTYRTFSFASTTLYTFITNYTCHGYVSSFFDFKTDNFRFVIYILIQESKIYKG